MMAEDVLAVLDHAGIRRASLVDTSLGGMIAQELALAHPERVDKLELVATIPGCGSSSRRRSGPRPCAAGQDRPASGGPKAGPFPV